MSEYQKEAYLMKEGEKRSSKTTSEKENSELKKFDRKEIFN